MDAGAETSETVQGFGGVIASARKSWRVRRKRVQGVTYQHSVPQSADRRVQSASETCLRN